LKEQIIGFDLTILTICNDNENNLETFFTKRNQTICNVILIEDNYNEKRFEYFSKVIILI